MKSIAVIGILLVGLSQIVRSSPVDGNDLDIMQSDDYYADADDESSDGGVANQQMKPQKPISNNRGFAAKAFFAKPNSTVTAVAGNDIILHCEVINLTDEVVLWYKGANVVANDGNVLLPMYSVDNKTHSLTIINATDSSQGEYFCELQPGKKRLYTNVVISREPLEEVVIPESSPSMQNGSSSASATSYTASCLIPLFVAFAFQYVVRI